MNSRSKGENGVCGVNLVKLDLRGHQGDPPKVIPDGTSFR